MSVMVIVAVEEGGGGCSSSVRGVDDLDGSVVLPGCGRGGAGGGRWEALEGRGEGSHPSIGSEGKAPLGACTVPPPPGQPSPLLEYRSSPRLRLSGPLLPSLLLEPPPWPLGVPLQRTTPPLRPPAPLTPARLPAFCAPLSFPVPAHTPAAWGPTALSLALKPAAPQLRTLNLHPQPLNPAPAQLRNGMGGKIAGAKLPYIPGIDVAGVVEEASEGSAFKPGTRVNAFLSSGGGYAEKVGGRGGRGLAGLRA